MKNTLKAANNDFPEMETLIVCSRDTRTGQLTIKPCMQSISSQDEIPGRLEEYATSLIALAQDLRKKKELMKGKIKTING